MRHFRQLPLTLAAALLLGTAPATAQKMDLTINVQTHNKNGICFLYFPLGEMELAISVKASNNNINVGIDDLPADIVEAGLDKENVPITLVLGNGKSVTTDGGAYRAGFQYRVSGYWEKTGDGAAILSYLKGGKEITAKVDGQSYGPFQIQQTTGPVKDYAYNWLKTCIIENGGKPNF